MDEKIYFLELWFNGFIDLSVIEGITKEEFQKILDERNTERKNECDIYDWIHADGYFDWIAYRVEKAGGMMTHIDNQNLVIDN